jgi:hypothetical protein
VEEELDNSLVSGSSAARYFASRPAPVISGAPIENYRITITLTTEPKDLQYPRSLQGNDVTQQDWATFVNYLLPDHTSTANNNVADRKLQAEILDERMQKFNLGPDDMSRSAPTEVDAQLEPLRRSPALPSSGRVSEARATISEWNDGFFGPRRVHIVVNDADNGPPSERANRMPGAWIPWENEISPEAPRGQTVPEARRTWGPFGGFRADAEGFRLGSIQADNNGFRIGNMLVAE